MADSPGLTRIEAVNRILRAWGMARISTLDSSGSWPSLTYGTSDAGEAESILDEVTAEVLTERWDHAMVDLHKTYTADGSGFVDLDEGNENVLKVRGSGDYQAHALSIRSGRLYDNVNNTANFGNGATVTLDVIQNIAFENLDPALKSLAVNRAVEYARNYKMPDELRAAIMARDVSRAEEGVDQIRPDSREQPKVPYPGLGFRPQRSRDG